MTNEEKTPEAASADQRHSAVSEMGSVLVAGIGLGVLLGIVAIAILALPSGQDKAANIVAIASSGFGVIGAIVGSYFGIRSADKAVDRAAEHPRPPETRGQAHTS